MNRGGVGFLTRFFLVDVEAEDCYFTRTQDNVLESLAALSPPPIRITWSFLVVPASFLLPLHSLFTKAHELNALKHMNSSAQALHQPDSHVPPPMLLRLLDFPQLFYLYGSCYSNHLPDSAIFKSQNQPAPNFHPLRLLCPSTSSETHRLRRLQIHNRRYKLLVTTKVTGSLRTQIIYKTTTPYTLNFHHVVQCSIRSVYSQPDYWRAVQFAYCGHPSGMLSEPYPDPY